MGDAWIAYAHEVGIDPGEAADVEAFHEIAHLTVPPGNYFFVGKGAVAMRASETTVWLRVHTRPHEGDVTPVTVIDGYSPFALTGIVSLGRMSRISVECRTEEQPVSIDYFRLVVTQVESLHWPSE